MKKIYQITVKLLSPLHINGGTTSDGVRISIKQNGIPYIPATLMKGVLRDKFEMLARTYDSSFKCNGKEAAVNSCDCLSCRMFGKAGYQKSKIIIDDLFSPQNIGYELKVNVAINRYLRKAGDGMLVTTEVVANNDLKGNTVVFTGLMTVYYPPFIDSVLTEKYLFGALTLIKNIGSGKSRGMGFVRIEVMEYAEKS